MRRQFWQRRGANPPPLPRRLRAAPTRFRARPPRQEPVPEQTSPLTEPTSTRRTRDKVVLPSAPIPSPVTRSRKSSSSHARATLTLTAPCSLSRLPSIVRISRRRLSRAHPSHVLLSTAQRKVHVRVPSARACGRCARRGWCVRLSPTSALSSPMHQQQAQAAHLIAIVNGRTYTRYALGLCTGLSRDASSQ